MRYEIEIMQVEDADWPSDRLLSNRVEDAGDDFVSACSRAERIVEEEELAVGADYVAAQVVGYREVHRPPGKPGGLWLKPDPLD